ncbi:C4-dicarboxylate ABC transporter substrate-binding protein [Lentibacillus kapialis]|uniref:C4-dicarboxylate ABC transporter substrate-binding protein n=1 Tax=Lentibacillus kapialis TaxID=340214 RepID=A0A917Q2J3_9BACI|nr:TRAP transporter large permease subunit [Lentibacillus kapialis]GGK08375.1 C4-dicarboxylate ABC transporter substrate-binding protein [Lentibacillus kapialis]
MEQFVKVDEDKPETPPQSRNKYLDILDRRFEEVLIVFGFAVFILMINAQVTNRYVLSFIEIANITTWTEELSRYFFIFASFLGASLAIRKGDSIRVNVLFDKLSGKWQQAIEIANTVFMLYFSYIMIRYGFELISFQLDTSQTTPAMGIPMAIPYSTVPIGFVLIAIRLIQKFLDNSKQLTMQEGLLGLVLSIVMVLPIAFLSNAVIPILLFGYFILFIFIGMPIAFSLGISTLATVLATDAIPVDFFPQTAFTSIDSFPIMAVPLFIAAGVIMGGGVIIQRLLNFSNELIGFLPGGLALVSIITSMFFAAISGSGPATVAAVGTILIPAMIKQGYNPGFATAVVATAGSIGVIIPPSNPLVIYGVMSQQSISKLFAAGIIPGILTGATLMIVTYFISKKNGWKGDKTSFNVKITLKAAWDAKLALLVPVIILGGIYGGLMTPTEAAAVAVAYGLIVGLLVYRDLNFKSVYRYLAKAGVTSSIIILIIVMASIFGRLITLEQVAETVANFVLGVSENKIVILLLLNLFLLLVGLVIEALAAIVIVTPILLPMATALGVDPIHFGVIMIFNLSIGFITPPVGVNLFVAASTAKLKIEEVIKGNYLLLGTMLVMLAMITFVPEISLWVTSFMD